MKHLFTMGFIKKCHQQLKYREISKLPEQIAFNLLMAIAPLMIALVQIVTYFSIQTDSINERLAAYLPGELQQLLTDFLQQHVMGGKDNTFVIIMTLIPFFWSISKGFYGIRVAANTTYQVPLMKFAYLERVISFLTLCFLMILLILIILSQHLLSLFLNMTFANQFSLWQAFQMLISLAVYFAFFLLLMYLAPNVKIKLKEIIPGALVATIGWSLISWVFAFYVNTIANYNRFYGSLSAIIILLMWLYILGFMITIGLQVNYILKRDYLGGMTYHPRLLFKWTKLNNTADTRKR